MFKEVILIGFSFLFSKFFFLIIPYLITAAEYKNFNENYYTASLLSILTIFVLDYVNARYSVKLKHLIIFCFITFTSIFIILSFVNDINLFTILLWINNLIISFTLTIFLYNSQVMKYFQINVLVFVLSLSSILISYYLLDLFSIYSILLFLFSLTLLPKLIRRRTEFSKINLKDALRLSFGIFIINSSAGLLFNYDKFLVNNYMDMNTANAFTFSWSVLVPALYIGNVFEKSLYSREKIILSFNKTFLLNMMSILAYLLFIWIILLNGYLIPKSVAADKLSIIIIELSIGIGLLGILHYPLIAVLLKSISSVIQNKLALAAVIISLTAITLLGMITCNNKLTISAVIIITFTEIIGINSFKGILIFKKTQLDT